MVPPNHPMFNRVFHYFNHPFWGVKHPYFWKPPYRWAIHGSAKYTIPIEWTWESGTPGILATSSAEWTWRQETWWRLKAWICLYKVMNTVCTMFHHPLRENICTYNLIYIYINLLGGVTFFIRIELQQIPGGASRMLVSNLTQSFFFQKLPWKNTHTLRTFDEWIPHANDGPWKIHLQLQHMTIVGYLCWISEVIYQNVGILLDMEKWIWIWWLWFFW